MNKLLLFALLFFSQILFAEVTSTFETDECFISFIECANHEFVVKQIKDSTPDEQFLLVLDALGCHIAETADIPMNKVTLIPANTAFTGKKVLELPATLHSLAPGVSTEQECSYQGIDVHQRFRKENSPMWHRWGPLPSEKTGLTIAIIRNMAKHPDLPPIVALDTFAGNADRSLPNLYYDELTDRFCGIDMAASFSSPLALAACRQLKGVKSSYFTNEELAGLTNYAHTLECLVKNWPPEKQEHILLEFIEMAGFKKGTFLFDQDVSDRIEFHKRCIIENYKNCVELIKVINPIVFQTM